MLDDRNIQAIADYFRSGEKPVCKSIGIELEHTLVRFPDSRVVSLDDALPFPTVPELLASSPVSYAEPHGVEWIMGELGKGYETHTFTNAADDPNAEHLIGLGRSREWITLEPAAQLEISAGPFTDLNVAARCFQDFEEHVRAIAAPQGISVLQIAYHPSASAHELTIIPKRRYTDMNEHFEAIGNYGRRMMRCSGSTQVSIDYSSERDAIAKMRIASALAPLFTLITDNAPVFEGAPRPHHMMRTEIWRYCDPARCDTVAGLFDDDFSWEKYAAYILSAPAVLIPNGHGGWERTEQTFAECYRDRLIERDDVMHALSMYFNDVRAKTYLEIRPADSLPIAYAIAYAALIKGLFYSSENLALLETALAGIAQADVETSKDELMAKGYDGSLYGSPAIEWAEELFDWARDGLPADEQGLLRPLAELVERKTTLAETYPLR